MRGAASAGWVRTRPTASRAPSCSRRPRPPSALPLLDPSTILGALLRAVRRHREGGAARRGARARESRAHGVDVRGRRHRHRASTSADGRVHGGATDRGDDRVRTRSALRRHLGADASARWPACRSRSSRCSTSSCGPIRSRSSQARRARSRTRSFAIRTCRCTSGTAATTTGSATTSTSRSSTPQAAIRPPRRADAASLMPFTPEDFDARRGRGRADPAGARRPHAPRGPRAVAQRDVLASRPDAGSIVGESRRRPRVLGLRGRVGHARRRHGPAGRRVDGRRRAELRPGRGRREPLLPVPDDAAVRLARGDAAVPRGLRHPASAPADDRAARPAAHAVPRAARGRSARSSSPARDGSARSGSRRTRRSAPDDAPWAPRDGVGGPDTGRRSVGAEHLADARARGAVRHHAVREVRRAAAPTRCAFLERVFANRIDRPVGSVVYTATLTPRGGIRLRPHGAPQGRGAVPRRDRRRQRPARPRVAPAAAPRRRAGRDHRARPAPLFALGLWGPRARDVLAAVTDADVSNDAFPYLTARYLHVGEVGPVWAQRISLCGRARAGSSTGSSRWAQRAWDLLWEAGREHGIAGGRRRRLRLAPPGEGLPAVGPGHPHRARPAARRPRVRGAVGQGLPGSRGARADPRAGGPDDKLACMTLDDPRRRRDGQGADPATTGASWVYVTSAAYGYSIGRGIVYGYLPADLAVEGTPVEVEYFGERSPPPSRPTRCGIPRANA